jgi:phage baseplate assembly protein V
MSYHEHDDAIRSMLRRATLIDTDDAGKQQKMRVKGLAGEELKDVVRVQPYGFTSHPPAGSEGLIASLGGRSDRAMLLGVEHPQHRPAGLGPGSTAIYDQHGNIVSLVQANLRIKHSTEIVIEVGGTKITLSAAGVQIDGPSVKHNAKNIGDTHTHGGIVVGSADTAVPNA